MSSKMKIASINTHRYFKKEVDDSVAAIRSIKCAFNLDRDCSPECAACEQRGANIACVRNGVDNEFQIGYID